MIFVQPKMLFLQKGYEYLWILESHDHGLVITIKIRLKKYKKPEEKILKNYK